MYLNEHYMRHIKLAFIISVLFLNSCDTRNNNETAPVIEKISSVDIIARNDTTLTSDGMTYHVDSLYLWIQDQGQVDEVHIYLKEESSMDLFWEIQSVCADYEIAMLHFHKDDRYLTYYYEPPPEYPTEATIITLGPNRLFLLDGDTLSTKVNLYEVLVSKIDTSRNSLVLVDAREGTSYKFYLDQNERINIAVDKIDKSTVVEDMATSGTYQEKK